MSLYKKLPTNTTVDTRISQAAWFSNPQTDSYTLWETLTVKLRKNLLITSLSFDLISVSQKYEVYVTTTTGNEIMLTDDSLNPFTGVVSGTSRATSINTWTTISRDLTPQYISQIKIRMKRTNDSGTVTDGTLYSLGVRNVLLKRSIYAQQDTVFPIDPHVDQWGNLVTKEIQNWDASLATDNDSYTFWKSAPQPSPDAVVSMYVSLGADDRVPSRIDKFWLDPVYTGANLNVYYSNDDTTGIVRPSTFAAPVSTTAAFDSNKGLKLLTNADQCKIQTNKLASTNVLPSTSSFGNLGWYGGWFEFAAPVAMVSVSTTIGSAAITAPVNTFNNPSVSLQRLVVGTGIQPGTRILSVTDSSHATLTQVATTTSTITLYFMQEIVSSSYTSLVYNPLTKQFVATVGPTGNTVTVTSPAFQVYKGTNINFVVAVDEDVDDPGIMSLRLIIKTDADGSDSIGSSGSLAYGLAGLYRDTAGITLQGPLGYFKAFILKTQPESDDIYNSFLVDPQSFISPIDYNTNQNLFASHNLDNAIYVADYLDGSFGYGGITETYFTEKTWTPIWKDWTVQTGYYYLPSPIAAKHMKFEFSNLTEQPYPIYESGITVPYQVFPLAAALTSASTSQTPQQLSATNVNGAISRDVFSPSTKTNLNLSSDLVRRIAPRTAVFLGSTVVQGIRNGLLYDSSSSPFKSESAVLSSVRGSTTNDVRDLAGGLIKSMTAQNGPVNNFTTPSPNANFVPTALNYITPNSLANSTQSSSLATRVPGWWVLPGGQLKISQSVMENMTGTSTQTEKGSSSSNTSTTRTRFPFTSVHRYDTKTATRDAGIAYFAGLRGIQIFHEDYTTYYDSDSYTILSYQTATAVGNITVNHDGDTVPAHVTAPFTSPSWPTMALPVWNSVGTYIKVAMNATDRPPYSHVSGQPLGPVGLTAGSATWADTITDWSDVVAAWGALDPQVGIDITSGVTYSGKTSTQIHRAAGVGDAGVVTIPFEAISGPRIRMRTSIFRPAATKNTLTLQLWNTATNVLSDSFPITVAPGSWIDVKTPFFIPTVAFAGPPNNYTIRLIVDGPDEETIYVSDLYDEIRSVIYYLSNDNGVNYYEATETIDEEETYLIFPKPGNQ
jgi:hypothetical protein